MSAKGRAILSVYGQDRKGVLAPFANFLVNRGIQIEDVDQHVEERGFFLTMTCDLAAFAGDWNDFDRRLASLGRALDVKVRLLPERNRRETNIAVLVTRETHALDQLLHDNEVKRCRGTICVVISNARVVEERCRRARVPFYYVPSYRRDRSECQILEILDRHQIDLIVLARYMQILSSSLVFFYRGRIINIHPSLLPAFPGPRAYTQAFRAGVAVAGVTAHFVTADLDRGPIIHQEAFTIDKASDSLSDIVGRGRKLEGSVLCQAVRLFCAGQLTQRHGVVVWEQGLAERK